MRPSQALLSLVQFLMTAVLLCLGGFFLFLPYAPHLRLQLSSLFSEREDIFWLMGGIFLGLGIVLLIGFYLMNRHSYYQLRMNNEKHRTTVDLDVLRQNLDIYWKNLFPNQNLTVDIFLHHDKTVEILVEIPRMGWKEERVILERLERDASALLKNHLDYSVLFFCTVLA